MGHANFFLKAHARPLLIAHRGANDQAPENTLSAFRVAAESKADACELDVHLTKDGQVVVFHDATLSRMTNGAGRISDYPWQQLKHLKITNGSHWEHYDEHIPLLYDVLTDLGHKLAFQIELKSFYSLRGKHKRQQLVEAVLKILHTLNLESRVVIKSFDPLALNAVKTYAPHVTCSYLLLPYAHGLGQIGPGRKAFADCEIIEPSPIRQQATIQRLHAQNKRVITWTVDNPNQAHRLQDWRVDGIVTNKIETLRSALQKK